MTAAGSYSGTITLGTAPAGDNGSLAIRHPQALAAGKIVINTTAGRPTGVSLGGPDDQPFVIAGLAGTTSQGAIYNADATPRTLVINQDDDTSFAGSFGGSDSSGWNFSVVKQGAGVLDLAGEVTYSGDTTVEGGTLIIPARDVTYADTAVTVRSGAVLGIRSGEDSLLIGSLDMEQGALWFINPVMDADEPVLDTLDIAYDTDSRINVTGNLQVGTYPLITYAYSDASGPLSLGTLPPGTEANLDDDGGVISLVVTKASKLTWTGNVNNQWDVGKTANWRDGYGAALTFYDDANAYFDDTGARQEVMLNGSVAPNSLSFTGTKDYTISGSGSIDGPGGIVKSGPSTLTLSTENGFTGSVVVKGGGIIVGADNALGSSPASVSIAEGAAVDVNGWAVANGAVFLGGSLVNDYDLPVSIPAIVTIDDSSSGASFGGAGDMTFTNPIKGSFLSTLVKTGAGAVTVSNASGEFLGELFVEEGILAVGAGNSLPNAAVTVGDGAVLRVVVTNALANKATPITILSGGTLTAAGGLTSNIGNTTITLQGGAVMAFDSPDGHWGSWSINNADKTINVSGGNAEAAILSANLVTPRSGVFLNLNVADVTGGPGTDLLVTGTFGAPYFTTFGLNIHGGGTVEITGNNTCAGATIVAEDSTLAGSGSLPAPITVVGTIAPGSPQGAHGDATATLSSGALTITGTYACEMDGDRSDVIAVSGDLDVSEATLDLSGATGEPSLVIATFSGTLTGPFAAVNGLPDGYDVIYDSADGEIRIGNGGTSPYDAWAASHGLAGPDAERGGDPDGDGFTNLQEYLFGSDPTAGNGSLATFDATASPPKLVWLQRPGATYTVEESTTLAAGSWVPSAGSITDAADQSGVPAGYIRKEAAGSDISGQRKFFRVKAAEN